jgi:phage shock protein PspC (stress-responsive transcriptional regulator)
MNRRLYRSVSDRKIGGVAAGTADYFDIDPSISRILWLLLALFTGGTFVIVYLVMWAIVPEQPWSPPAGDPAAPVVPGEASEGSADAGDTDATDAPADEPTTPTAPQAASTWSASTQVASGPSPQIIVGAILILIGGWFLAQQFFPWLNFGTLWPIGLVAIGVIILVAALRRGG